MASYNAINVINEVNEIYELHDYQCTWIITTCASAL